jgi:hypothetical protein
MQPGTLYGISHGRLPRLVSHHRGGRRTPASAPEPDQATGRHRPGTAPDVLPMGATPPLALARSVRGRGAVAH